MKHCIVSILCVETMYIHSFLCNIFIHFYDLDSFPKTDFGSSLLDLDLKISHNS